MMWNVWWVWIVAGFALGVLGFDALGPAAHPGSFAAAFHFGDVGGHGGDPLLWVSWCDALP